jgi:glucan phosphoethanolaminetransferase (alkaline phosphatase superfamily)
VGTSGLLAFSEYVLLTSFARQSIASVGSGAFLLLLLFGNLLPYALLASVVFAALDALLDRLGRRVHRAGVVLAAATGLVALPYGMWLAAYTFGGVHASQIAGRRIYMGIECLLVAGSFAAAARFWSWRRETRRLAPIAAIALIGLALIFTWASQHFHANRYEPLHAFLALWGLILAWLGVHEALPAIEAAPRGKTAAAIAAACLLVFAASTHLLSYTREDLAWIVWSETPISGYMTYRLRLPAMRSTGTVLSDLPPIKPEVDTERTAALREERRMEPAPNIVLFFIDNVQTDHVGAYGYARHPSTPNFDALAERGVLFERAYASYPQTRNFTSAVLLGRFVPTIRSLTPPIDFADRAITRVLKQERDYHIFVQGWFEASSTDTLDPAFYRIDTFSLAPRDDDPRRKGPWPIAPMDAEFEKILVHLEEAKRLDKPVFLWVHLIYPHWNPQGVMVGSEAFPFGDRVADRYDSAIADCDAWIPRVDDAVRRALPERETVWIVGSDHGAGLGRFDKMVGKTIYDVHAKVPFLVVAPGIVPRRISVPVDVPLDTAATLLDLAGIEPPDSYDGVSLVPMMIGEPPVERPILLNQRGERYQGVVFREWKLIRTQDATTLFNLIEDPEERRNLAGDYPAVAEQLSRVIDVHLPRRFAAFEGR